MPLNENLFLTGLRCPRALWLEVKTNAKKSNFKTVSLNDTEEKKFIAKAAQKLFPNGLSCRIGENFELNAIETQQQIHGCPKQPIFDAFVQFNGTEAFCDILFPDPCKTDFWHMIKVMAAARLMRRHINDLAMTWHIFNSSGINISRSMLAFVDTSYTRNGDLDPEKLFKLLDVTPQVWATLPRVPQILETQQDVLLSPNEPLIFPGAHCLKPSPCSFVDSCWTALTPQDRSKAVQGVGWRDVKPLIQEGYLDLTLLSEISGIRIPKASLLEAAATKTPIINKEAIKKHLDKLVYPLHFLDFETIAPAAPIFSGTSPFETIPAQASLHIVKTPGDWSEPLHFEFITSGNTDPRPEIAQFLTSFVKAEGSIVAYNAKFEYSVLAGLAVHLPMLREALRGMMARLWDLYTPFQKGHFIHPDFRAGFSLKAIAPILAPEINYRNLKIQDGLKASIALFKLFINHDDQSKKNQLMKDLKTYCAMDTLALVQITKRLKNTFQQA